MPASKDKPEFKSFALRLTKAPDEDGHFEGYAAVFGNEDSDGDVIEPGAFTKTLQENPIVPILWQHDSFEPIGVSLEMSEDAHGLKVAGQLELETQRGREARALMLRGALKGLSIGYTPIKAPIERNSAGSLVRRLKELKLWEWSPVTFPANQLAAISGVKAAGAAGERLRKYYDSVYWDDDYQQIGALLTMISCGTEFAISEGDEDDAEDVAAMQAILASLAELLASELSELGADDENEAPPAEAMSARLATILCKEGEPLSDSTRKLAEHAVEALTALLTPAEPGKSTQPARAAKKDDVEPELASTLESLTTSMRSPRDDA